MRGEEDTPPRRAENGGVGYILDAVGGHWNHRYLSGSIKLREQLE